MKTPIRSLLSATFFRQPFFRSLFSAAFFADVCAFIVLKVAGLRALRHLGFEGAVVFGNEGPSGFNLV